MTDQLEHPAQADRPPRRSRREVAAEAIAGAVRLWHRTPGWGQALVLYALTRLWAFVVVARAARFQAPSVWTPASSGYLDMATLWDSVWYERIALTGYPDVIPRGEAGDVQQNEWAFYPLFPMAVRAVMTLTGASYDLVAPTLALVVGFAAAAAVYALLTQVAGHRVALGGVLLVGCYPAAPVLQIAYTESTGLALVALALLLLVRRRYVWALPIVVLLGLTRPITAPLAGVVGVHLLVRMARRRTDPFPRGEVAAVLLLGVVTTAATALWPALVWIGSGERAGYTTTMAAWRSGAEIVLARPWRDMSTFVLGEGVGPAVLVGLLAAFAWFVLSRHGRVVGTDLQAWCLLYMAYLVVVLDPYTSTFRYLLLLFPMAAMLAALSRSRAYLAALAVAGLAGQVVWVVWLLRFEPPSDWPP